MHYPVLKKVIVSSVLYAPGDQLDSEGMDPRKLTQLVALRYLGQPEPAPTAPPKKVK